MKKVLALDMATITGWADSDGNSGIESFKITPKETKEERGLKFHKMYGWLFDKILEEKSQVDLIIYEKPVQGRYTALRSSANFEGVLLHFCHLYSINYEGYSPNTIKAFARKTMRLRQDKAKQYPELLTKKGNYGKPEMVKSAEIHFIKTQIIDDNHADALWLLAYYQDLIK